MTSDKGILIKNIYYMLTYAFQILRQDNYVDISTEEFEYIHDMFAAILGKGVAQQLKQGLYKEYICKQDDMPVMRGKININGTLKNKLAHKQVLSCEYDELSENNLFNQIIKRTMLLLLHQKEVKSERKSVLKKNLLFFDGIDDIDLSTIKWNMIRYQRNNQNYKMLLNICRLIMDGLLLSTEDGQMKMATFFKDEVMCTLYEKFILNYYRHHHPEYHANPDQIEWNLDDDNDLWLPEMQTDITLKYEGKTLIIDAKYYGKQMQTQYDVSTFRSANLYQIFTYVKNLDKNNTGNVAGTLLYAKTSEDFQPTNDFHMGGNKISVDYIDLNQPFIHISEKLEKIAVGYFDAP